MKVPFLNFGPMHKVIKHEIIDAFEKVYDSNWFILGNSLDSFEKSFSCFNCVKHTVGVSNGLDALHLALKSVGIKKGDEVIVPSNTYIATWMAVSYLGAIPVPVEPNIFTYNIDVDKIESFISSKTKAIIPVHLYGQACQMDKIMELANKYDLKVIEDNAQAIGARFNNQITGSFGDINATSFYPGKNLGALGDAGAITTNQDHYADKVRLFRNYGSNKKYYHEELGFNMRLDEMQAAFLDVKLKYIKLWTEERKKIANWYIERLSGIDELILPSIHENSTHVFHLFVIRSKYRDELKLFLELNGIGTLIHYPVPPHLQNAYKEFNTFNLPIASELANTILSLPLWVGMTEDDVAKVTDAVKLFYKSK